ncbi:hypothetical protein K3172_03195 [Qipengyuania sp. 6B39]|uniref:Calx-beta domain-containing protein n=1 Tax=Qipengyuania proteolytica TaxID=2867239 RepID=UPI001C8A84A5|nr:hypothetical protein [Qipengyuania proteolytica]
MFEGGTLNFTVRLSAAHSSSISVSYATAYGSAGSTDFTAVSGTVTIPAGATAATVSVASRQDAQIEADETFTLNLSSPTAGATIADGQGIGTIFNDDEDIGEPTCGKYVC